MDGHTYYFLLDDTNVLHICSNGFSRCGKSAMDFTQVEDSKLKLYELCSTCQITPKKASFETKAEFIEEE